MVNNTKYGSGALQNNKGTNNTAIGAYTAYNNLDASNNTAVGSNSSFYNTSGSNNTALGAGSLCNNTTGMLNTAIGSSALEGPAGQSVGNQNVAVGVQALYVNQGSLNTAVGSYAAEEVDSSYNTFLGANTSFDNIASRYEYSTAIGYNAKIDASNEIMLGGLNNSGLYPNVVIPGQAFLTGFQNTGNEDQIVPKSYVDTVASGLQPTQTCICATTSNISFSGVPLTSSTDGVNLSTFSDGSYNILVVNQGSSSTSLTLNISNGVWIMNKSGSTYSWSRPPSPEPMSINYDATGAFSFIEQGTLYGKTALVQIYKNSSGLSIVGTDQLQYQTFYQVKFQGGPTGSFGNLTTSNNTYLATESGKVGIGTTTPSTLLSLGNSVSNYKLAIYDGGPNSIMGIGANNSCLTFGSVVTTTQPPQMVLNNFGHLGIGTTTPSTLLSLGNSSTNYKLAIFDNGTNSIYGIGANNSSLTFGAAVSTSTQPQMVLNSSGHLGIGTTTPSYTLDVTGNARISAGITGPTGSFTYLSASQGITGPTGSFRDLVVTNQIKAPGGITGATGFFSNVIAGYPSGINIQRGSSDFSIDKITINSDATNNLVFQNTSGGSAFKFITPSPSQTAPNFIISGNNNNIFTVSSINGGPVGSVGINTTPSGTYNFDVSGNSNFRGGITGPTGSFTYLSSSNNTYLATTSGKSVGIGKTTTSALLDVNGDALIHTLTVGLGKSSVSTNTVVGYQSLLNNSSGSFNTALGYQALSNINIGQSNTAIGYSSGKSISTGFTNTLIGSNSGQSISNGVGNTIIGGSAGTSVTGGGGNTIIGWQAGTSVTNGSNNTVIGINASSSTATVTDEITLGDSSITALRCAVTSISSLSDSRDKKNIELLKDNSGLEFVDKLKPVDFVWNMRDGGKVDVKDQGFIAQDLKKVQDETNIYIPGLVYDVNPERLEASYGRLIPIIVQAIKDLKAELDILKNKSI